MIIISRSRRESGARFNYNVSMRVSFSDGKIELGYAAKPPFSRVANATIHSRVTPVTSLFSFHFHLAQLPPRPCTSRNNVRSSDPYRNANQSTPIELISSGGDVSLPSGSYRMSLDSGESGGEFSSKTSRRVTEVFSTSFLLCYRLDSAPGNLARSRIRSATYFDISTWTVFRKAPSPYRCHRSERSERYVLFD